jgi:hypothetical protein
MPSNALLRWQTDRLARLREFDAQCAACVAAVPANLALIDENLRGYVMLLSAHFQGFCRDLHTECAQVIGVRVRPTLRLLIQSQFAAGRKLDVGNPTVENLRADFSRFGFRLDLSSDPANVPLLGDLAAMNQWRNVAAHHGTPPATPLNLPTLRSWVASCEGLAASLDDIMYNQLRRLLRRTPW